ncbi:Alpha/Beta hydrolase protein [Blastocladiella britannica]|nr:Alpha/Beta hydrolase protein [Blastocladiella britannica]
MVHTDTSPIIPIEHFFTNPDRAVPLLSPDHMYLSYRAPGNTAAGNLQVWVQPLAAWRAGTDEGKVQVTNHPTHDIRMYKWTRDSKSLLFLQDKNGNENFHLFIVDRDGGEARDLTPFDNVTIGHGFINLGWVEEHKTQHGRALVALNHEDPRRHDVYELDLVTSTVALHTRTFNGAQGVIASDAFEVKIASITEKNGSTTLRTFNKAIEGAGANDAMAERWPVVLTVPASDSVMPVRWVDATDSIELVTSVGHETVVLVDFDPVSKGQTLVAKGHVDIGKVKLHPLTQVLQMASYNPGRTTWTLVDESLRTDFDRVEAYARDVDADYNFGDHENDSDAVWILRLSYANKPHGWVLYHKDPAVTRAGSTDHFEVLFGSNSKLADVPLGRMESINYPARDGLPLQAYATYPAGYDKTTGGRLPTVLMVHGGPWARDVFGYQSMTMWLANRGYLVLQPNFRGSIGFNKKHMTSSFKQWGKDMQTDLLDTVEHAVALGVADREHVAIFGASYGGYAALAGVTLTPNYFTCAVDVVGPSNLKTLLGTVPPYWEALLASFYTRIGHPKEDSALLDDVSPLTHAHKIVTPLLIAQGKNDPRVKEAESEQIVQAIADNGGNVYYVMYPDEGHGLARPANRIDFFTKSELFLSKYMGDKTRLQDGLSLNKKVEGSTAVVRVVVK